MLTWLKFSTSFPRPKLPYIVLTDRMSSYSMRSYKLVPTELRETQKEE